MKHAGIDRRRWKRLVRKWFADDVRIRRIIGYKPPPSLARFVIRQICFKKGWPPFDSWF